MRDSASISLRTVQILTLLAALAILPFARSILVYPIGRDSVYLGPIAAGAFISVALWFAFEVACVIAAAWVHFRHPGERRSAWYTVLAGPCAFMLLFAVCGSVINRVIDGRWNANWGDLVFVAIAWVLWLSLKRMRLGHNAR